MQEIDLAIIDNIPFVRRYARALTGEFELADQLVQQSVSCAVDLHHLFKEHLGIDKKIWLFSIFHNLYNDFINQQKNSAGRESEEFAVSADYEGKPILDVNSDTEYQALHHLPAPLKQVFLLVAVERFLYEDVCKILNIPLGAVLSHLHTARKSLAMEIFPPIPEQEHTKGRDAGVEEILVEETLVEENTALEG